MSYLGTAWRRDIAFAGYGVALQGDFSAGEMIRGVKDVDAARREKLIKLLRIDEDWRMMRVSDGQRRRVQICLGLLKPYKVLLLDEITVDLDIVGRYACRVRCPPRFQRVTFGLTRLDNPRTDFSRRILFSPGSPFSSSSRRSARRESARLFTPRTSSTGSSLGSRTTLTWRTASCAAGDTWRILRK